VDPCESLPILGSSLVTSTNKGKKKREKEFRERKSLERERLPREESLSLKLPKNPFLNPLKPLFLPILTLKVPRARAKLCANERGGRSYL
jgi:hypothetical protein